MGGDITHDSSEMHTKLWPGNLKTTDSLEDVQMRR